MRPFHAEQTALTKSQRTGPGVSERHQEIPFWVSWNLTFMQNQMEKGKVTMMKSRDVRTRSHSQTPKPEDLVPKTKQKKKGGGKNTYTGNVTIFTDQYLFIQFLVGGSEQCVDFARNLEGAGYQWSVHMMGHCLGRAL